MSRTLEVRVIVSNRDAWALSSGDEFDDCHHTSISVQPSYHFKMYSPRNLAGEQTTLIQLCFEMQTHLKL